MKKETNTFLNILYIIIVVAVIVAALVVSYAIFSYVSDNNSKTTITTGTLIMSLEEENSLSLVDSNPISDSKTADLDSYNFSVENTGTENSNYRIYLVNDTSMYTEDGCEALSWSNLKYSLTKNGEVVATSVLPDDGVLYTTTLKSTKTDNYELRLWISSTAGNDVINKHLHAKLNIKAILENRTNYDTGA